MKISKLTDDDLVKMIDRAIIETFEADPANFFTAEVPIFAKQGQTVMRITGEYERPIFARAVLEKLRAEGVIR